MMGAMSPPQFATFVIPGRVAGKARHRTRVFGGRAMTYDDPANKPVVARIRAAWEESAVRLPDTALAVRVDLHEQRPAGHWTKRAALSAAGRRAPFPARKPDLDNVAKQICDALNGLLWRDDAQVADLHLSRWWLDDPTAEEYAELTAYVLNGDGSDT